MQRIWAEQEGLTTVEYAVLLALIVVAAIAAWTTFGQTVQAKVASSTNSINGIS
jgi:Flp pilus assembly pilin Flp